MKLFSLFLLILLSSCGSPHSNLDKPVCKTLEEQRAICFIEEMSKLGHDKNMEDWVKNQCSIWYSYNGCYINSK